MNMVFTGIHRLQIPQYYFVSLVIKRSCKLRKKSKITQAVKTNPHIIQRKGDTLVLGTVKLLHQSYVALIDGGLLHVSLSKSKS